MLIFPSFSGGVLLPDLVERDINIALKGPFWVEVGNPEHPFAAMLISRSIGTCLIATALNPYPGPYAQTLLGMSNELASDYEDVLVGDKRMEVLKPGVKFNRH